MSCDHTYRPNLLSLLRNFLGKSLFVFVFSCFSLNLAGQGTNIKFKHLSIKEGLSQSTINAIVQDQLGFMWFGTQDGLNRFNGYDFTVYKHDIEDSSTIVNSFINCFYLDRKGHLWIGTNSGLSIYRHELNGFVSLNDSYPALLKLKDLQVSSITAAPDSGTWIGTDKGLFLLTGKGHLNPIPLPVTGKKDQATIEINALLTTNNNLLWVGTDDHGLFQYEPATSKWIKIPKAASVPSESGINSDQITVLHKGRNGRIYIGTNFGLNFYHPQSKTFTSHTFNDSDPFSLSSNFVTSIFEDQLGNLWIGTNGGGLNKYSPTKEAFYRYRKNVNVESSIISNDIVSIFQDNSGILWIGTSVGLSKFDLLKQNFNHFQFDQGTVNSISRNIIWSILSEGNTIWVGSNEGLNKYNRERNINEAFTPSVIVNDEKRNNAIYALKRTDPTTLLVGTDGGLLEFDTRASLFRKAYFGGQMISDRTYAIFRDREDQLWIGTRKGLFLISKGGSNVARYTTKKGLPGDVVRVITQDDAGNIWIGTDNGLCKVTDGKIANGFRVYTYEQGNVNSLRNNTILSIVEDADHFLWIGTFGGGLNRLDPTRDLFLSYTEKDGLPNNVIYAILEDEKNNLWCSTNNGIFRFNTITKMVRSFDEYDGLQSNEFNVGAYHKDESGEMFFGGIKGINSFFPSNIQINNLPPQLVITEFQLFNKPVEVESGGVLEKSITVTHDLSLPHNQNVFSFSFSALHYSMPERNRYAYKLEGFDENWIFDDFSRRAKYTNLDPGQYTFKVKGTNSDGIWSDEVMVNILIRPPFWRIWWIQVLAILLVVGGVFGFYRNRLRVIQQQKENLEKEVEQRTIEVMDQKEEIEKQKVLIEEEKEKLETLLLNVLPESTVEELKVKGKATARNYNKVSVMFTDFKGFTKISESLTPTDLVAKLDSFFVKFDSIIEKYNVEKIKTIGDAYMCAGGIPIRNKSNPVDVVLASLEIQRYMNEFNKEALDAGETQWGLRLGVHTGIIIAGVIGIKRFAYDIWGDTVNVASRIETNGEEGKVNVSEATFEEVRDYFDCEYRGKIHAKNKGEIDMYFIHRIKSYLSVDGKGIEPNETFWEYVNLNLFSAISYHDAETHVLNRLKTSLPDNLYYHNVEHTIDVCSAVERIALSEGIHDEELYILKMAALYHDAGFIEKYQNNEEVGARMARKDLPEFGFTTEQIKLVEDLIMVTFATKKPTTLLEQILRDADLDYLGREDFHIISDNLKKELLERKMIRSAEQWDELQVKFLESHEYHTESERILRNSMKEKHLEEIKERLKKKAEKKIVN